MENIKIFQSRSRMFETTGDYQIFNELVGNRFVRDSRVQKIKNSILRVGYITNPIIVNEKLEIIDGQGRLQALKELSLPVDYIVIPGAGIEECISLNLEQENWKVIDFVKSYKDQGNKNYERIYQLMNDFKNLGTDTIMYAIYGVKVTMSTVKQGNLECTEQEYNDARNVLDFLTKFDNREKKINSYLLAALVYCYWKPDIDNEKLLERFNNKSVFIHSPSGVLQAFDEISNIYSSRGRSGKVFLATDYQRDMSDKYSWYRKRYMKIVRTGV